MLLQLHVNIWCLKNYVRENLEKSKSVRWNRKKFSFSVWIDLAAMVCTDQLQTKKAGILQMCSAECCWCVLNSQCPGPGLLLLGLSWFCFWTHYAKGCMCSKAGASILHTIVGQILSWPINLFAQNLIECNAPLTILNKQTKKYFSRFLTDVKIALPFRHESRRCSHRDPCMLTTLWIRDLFCL